MWQHTLPHNLTTALGSTGSSHPPEQPSLLWQSNWQTYDFRVSICISLIYLKAMPCQFMTSACYCSGLLVIWLTTRNSVHLKDISPLEYKNILHSFNFNSFNNLICIWFTIPKNVKFITSPLWDYVRVCKYFSFFTVCNLIFFKNYFF